jgi:hypothetical protein
VDVELSHDECDLVEEILRSEYQDLREEIVKTDRSRFKDMLRERKRLLAGILAKIPVSPLDSSTANG